ncbi:MAG: glycosyltransferase family 4 protein, partial [Nitrospiraceae bacterium]|nr:glycosyltransferase family 4 protein [Nitrospiraceae bacterium]
AVPSLFEGFGLSATEAMAAGVPVVATRVDGLSEVVEDRASGFLFNRGDSLDLAKAISDLLLDPQKANEMGQEGYRRVSEKFSFEKFRDSVTGAYKEFGTYSPVSTEL